MRRLALLGLTIAASAMAAVALSSGEGGARTSTPALVSGLVPGVEVAPLISTGDTLPGGYVFESIPDGIAVHQQSATKIDLYVNHELSLVPFPVGFSDYGNAMLSKLAFDPKARDVTAGAYVIPSSANFQRFCSNFLATTEHGFKRPVVFTNEEATDRVARTGTAFPPVGPSEQAGVVVAYDIKNDKYKAVYSMGRHNHENAVALPGYKVSVILSGDDTFSAPASQLYLYLTHGANGVMSDAGALYGFKSDDPSVNDYGDFTPGKTISGTFVRVPVAVATGDQDALESWSNANNVFQFIRVEDITYDRNTPNVVYFADTGEPRALPDPVTTRLRRGPSGTAGPYPNGRIFKLVLDKKNPLKVTSLSVLIDGDSKGAAGVADVSLIHNPDNVETTKKALIFQEDPGSQNRYPVSDPKGVNARIWVYDLKTGQLTAVAQANQAALDPNSPKGEWETSGIVDASAVMGPGWFFTSVQAHTVNVQQEQRGSTLFKREAGQLLLLKLPGT